MDAYHEWLLVLRPGETLTPEAIERLQTWKKQKKDDKFGYSIAISDGQPKTSMRLVNRLKINWTGELPPQSTQVQPLPSAA